MLIGQALGCNVFYKHERLPEIVALLFLEGSSGRFRFSSACGILFRMAGRERDWMRQAESDHRHARNAREDGDFDWACFAAQQSAEKALKAAHQAVGNEAWGHSVAELLHALCAEVSVADGLMDRAHALDKLYIPTRYPNGLPGGAPADCYTRAEADRAIEDAEAVLALCREVLSR